MKNIKKTTLFLMFLTILLGTGTPLVAQKGKGKPIPINPEPKIDFSNRILTDDDLEDHVIEIKRKLDSIINNAPFVFEGRIIESRFGETGNLSLSYLFEIEKVYRGEDRLQVGTVEIIQLWYSMGESPFVDLYNPFLIFANEFDTSNLQVYSWYAENNDFMKVLKDELVKFDANNSIKLDLFYKDGVLIHTYGSFFAEKRDVILNEQREIIKDNGLCYSSNFGGLNFKTKEELRDFLATYNLFPKEMPKVDTLKTASRKEVEEAKKAAIWRAEKAEKDRENYRAFLELKWGADLEKIEEDMQYYDNASYNERQKLLGEGVWEWKMNRVKENAEKKRVNH